MNTNRSLPLLAVLIASGLLLLMLVLNTPKENRPAAPAQAATSFRQAKPAEPTKNFKEVVAQALAAQNKNFDKRPDGKTAPPLSDRQRLAVEALRKEVPDVQVDFDPLFGSPKYVVSTSRFLTQSQQGAAQGPLSYEDAKAKVKAFVTSHVALFPHGTAALDAGLVKRQDTTAATGLQTVVWEQQAAGLPVYRSVFKANLSKTGEIMTLASEFLPDANAAAESYLVAHPNATASPAVSIEKAVSLAAGAIGKDIAPEQVVKTASPNANLRAEFFDAPGLSSSWAEKVWLPMDAATVRLAWAVTVESPMDGMFTVLVDADSGGSILRQSMTVADATPKYRVWTGDSPTPMSPGFAKASDATAQPPTVARSLLQLESINAGASPSGWISTGGTTTTGNNVDAYTDRDGDNVADAGSRPTGTGTDSRTFDFSVDLTKDPSTFVPASVTQLFYRCNWMHDQLYSLGFTETAGNFQTNNFGRNGNPATDPGDQDAVNAEAQDAVLSTVTKANGGQQFNNSNFSTPADGFKPRMQMYLYNGPNPDRDASFDATMVLHEYTHGLSSRLVGAGVGISNPVTAGMGEGWSDIYALSLTTNQQQDPHANYLMFAYLERQASGVSPMGEANYFWGSRRYPYSTDLLVNPLTFKDTDPTLYKTDPHASVPTNPIWGGRLAADEPHCMGEVWCSMLWEARARMVDRYGWATGNQTLLQLVTDGMKNAPANPNFVQARNAILQADVNDYGGANLSMLWNAFAKRGLGNNATAPASTTTAGLAEDFTVPPTVDVTPAVIDFSPLLPNSSIYEFTTTGSQAVGGTVNEAARVTFQIEEKNAGDISSRYWNGSAWVTDLSAPGIWLAATVTGNNWVPADGVVLPSHANTRDGTYFIYARAVDNGGNIGQRALQVNRTVTAETTPPTIAITYPGAGTISGLDHISGTASDTGGSGLSGSIDLVIVGPDGRWWDGTAWQNSLNHIFARMTTASTWEYRSLPSGANIKTGSYHVTAKAFDWNNNVSAPNSGNDITFTVNPALDTSNPTVQIMAPLNNSKSNSLVEIKGNAGDVGAGLVLNVNLSINNGSDYWSGSDWTSTPTTVQAPVALDGTWSYTHLPTGFDVRTGTYSISATVFDYAGHQSSPQSGVTNLFFTLDDSPPTLTINAPGNGSSQIAFPNVTVSASDSQGVQGVVVLLKRDSDSFYWNGSAWTTNGLASFQPTTYNSGNQTYSGNFTLPVLNAISPEGSYTYTVAAVDVAGNAQFQNAQFTVAADTTPPTVTIDNPQDGSTITSGPVTFKGTAADTSGIWGMNCFIRRGADSLYWNGSAWGSPPFSLPSTYDSGTHIWNCTATLPQLGSQLADGSYTFIAIANDNPGNHQELDSNVTVTNFASTVPVLYLRGDSLTDASGHGHTATKSDDVTFTTGRTGQGFGFPGNDTTLGTNAVTIPDSLDFKPANLTVSVWVKFADQLSSVSGSCPGGEQFIVAKQNTRTYAGAGFALDYALLKTADGHLWFGADFGQYDEVAAVSKTTVIAGQWYHLVGTYDHQNFKLYVNGRLEGTTAETRNLDHAATPLYLGRTNASEFDGLFNGVMDEVQFFDTALTPDQIPAVDPAYSGDGLVSWWRGEGNGKDFQGSNDGGAFGVGKAGRAFQFDGTNNEYVLIGDPVPASLQIQNEITLDAWIYLTAYPASDALALVVGSQDDATHSGASIFLDGRTNPDGQPAPPGHIHFQIGGDGAWHGTNVNAQVPLNQWVHIAATRKANEDAKVYYDGVLQPSTSVPWSGAISYDGAWFAIGRQKDMGGRPFNGLIDEVDVFNRALVQSEVQAIHDAGAAGKNPAALPAGLVSWWRGEDNANDAQGSHNGTLVVPEAYDAAGEVGQAFKISAAAGNYLSIPDSSSLHVKTLTIDAWVNFSSLPGVGHIFGKALGGGDANSYILWYQDGYLRGYTEGGPQVTYGWSPTPGQWYHVAYTFDGGTHKLYVDGSEVASGANTAVLSYDTHPALIGADYSNGSIKYFFDGKIDEVDLFNRALSGSEINAIYTAGAAGKTTAPSVTIADASCVGGSSGTTNMVFNVSVLRPTASPISVNYASLDGTAVAGIDYTSTSGTLNIPANTASATITVPVTGNASALHRSFYLKLSNATNASINNACATGNILNGNAVTDFDPGANNPSQLWQYGHTETDGTGFTRYSSPIVGVTNNGSMLGWGGYFDGGVIFNPTLQAQGYNSGTLQPSDELGMFPTSNGAKSVVRWTAPAGGCYQVGGQFEGIDQGGGGTSSDATIVKNGDTAHPLHFGSGDNSGINDVNGYQTQKTFSFYINVNTGDTLDFRVGWGSNNNYSYDGTGFKATVTRIVAPVITNANFPFTGGQLDIVGGTGPYTVTVTSGSPPEGLAISPSGLVTGTAANGPYNFTLHIVDSSGTSSDFNYSGGLANLTAMPSSIIAWWPAEGADGDVIGDHHAAMMNGADYAAGKVGRAFTFDGVDDFVQRFDGSGLDLAGDFTIEGWVYLNQYPANDATVISKRSGDDNDIAYVLFLDAIGRPCFTSRSNGGPFTQASSTSAVATNTWTHLAVTLAGGQITFYLNGVQTYTAAYTASRPAASSSLVTIGATITNAFPASSPGNALDGMLDELSLYSSALTGEEISGIYAAGTSGKARYDGARDFAQFQTAGSPWSCRWLPASASMTSYDPAAANSLLLPEANSFDTSGIQGFGGPSYVSFNPASTFVINNGGATQYDWAPRQLGMGPGAGSEFAVLRWKAPAAGSYAVSGTFFGCDTLPTSVDVHIFHNAAELTPADKRYVNSYRGNGVSHTQVITVSVNDTVDFVVGAGGNGYAYDSSGLAASIVPLSLAPSAAIVVEQPAGSSLSSDTSTVPFGSSNIGVEVQKTFVIKNTGASALHLDSTPITIDGDNYLDFSFDPPPVLTLAPGASTTFTAGFYPLATGPREAHIHIGSDSATGSPFNIKLTGTGFSGSPHIIVEQPANSALSNGASVDCGSGVAGGGIDRAFVIKNSGSGVLDGIVATIDGTNAADFSVITAPASTLAPNGTSSLIVRFAGSATGARNATLHIASDDPTDNPFNVTLNGTATGTVINGTFNSADDVPLTVDGLNATGLTLNLTLNYAPAFGTSLTLVHNTSASPIEGTLSGHPAGSTVSLSYGGLTYNFILTYTGGTGNDIVLVWPGSSAVGWGDNVYGRTGDGTTGGNKLSPVAVTSTGALAGKTVTSVAAGYQHSLALTADGKVYAWGRNDFGMLGDGTNTDSNVPVAVDTSGVLAGKSVIAISAGLGFSVALTADGQVFSWGTGSFLGRGNSTNSNLPVAVDTSGVLAGKTVTDISAGWYHVLVRTSDGRVFGWGNNGFGQLGDGSKTNALSPVAMDVSSIISSGKTIKAVSAGYVNSMVLTADNIMFICGDNTAGQLGLGASNSAYPTATILVVPDIAPLALPPGSIAHVIAGAFQNYAITTDGRGLAWGDSSGGALGVANPDATTGQSPVFVDMTGALSGKVITAVSAGAGFAAALTSEGQIFSWGINPSGQLGNGTTTSTMTPVAVDTTGVLAGRKATFIAAAPYGFLAVATAAPAPSIVVEKPGGGEVVSGVTTLELGTALLDSSATLTVTIRNTGNVALTNLVMTTTGDNADDFVTGTPGTTTVAPDGSTTFDITFTPAAFGGRTAMLHIASNDPTKTPFDLLLTGTGGVPITAWRQDNFGTTANAGAAADNADPDHDGVNNLLEFATTGDPTISDAPLGAQIARLSVQGDTIEFSYARNKQAMAELTYQVEWNDGLSPTGWSSAGVTESILSDNGVIQQIKAYVPKGGRDRRFVHLLVTKP